MDKARPADSVCPLRFPPLRDLLERVTMGERPWADVQAWCAKFLVEYAVPQQGAQAGSNPTN